MSDPIQLPENATVADLQAYIVALEAMKGWTSATVQRKCFLMAEEVGELFKAVRLHDREPSAERVDDVADEIVDVLNYLCAIANRLDIDIEAAFRSKNGRNQRRTWR